MDGACRVCQKRIPRGLDRVAQSGILVRNGYQSSYIAYPFLCSLHFIWASRYSLACVLLVQVKDLINARSFFHRRKFRTIANFTSPPWRIDTSASLLSVLSFHHHNVVQPPESETNNQYGYIMAVPRTSAVRPRWQRPSKDTSPTFSTSA